MWRTGNGRPPATTGTTGRSQAGIAYCIGFDSLFSIGLFVGRRVGEGRQRVACGLDAPQRRIRRKIDREAARVRQLRYEANIGERRRNAMTEGSGRGIAREAFLERLEADVDPV